tara:strand:- start:1361 stop:1612 length:252 start_codon:yes stop_codon:yes gene_type:complete
MKKYVVGEHGIEDWVPKPLLPGDPPPRRTFYGSDEVDAEYMTGDAVTQLAEFLTVSGQIVNSRLTDDVKVEMLRVLHTAEVSV